MSFTRTFILIGLAASLMAGCTDLKRMTGQVDSTQLPGQRSDVLPPDQQQARDPNITGQPAPPSTMPPDAITQQPVNPAPGTKTGLPVAQPENQNLAACDPKIDLCPQALPAEPLPPPSKPMKVADTGKGAKTKATDTKCPTDKVVDGTKAGDKVIDGTKPADCTAKTLKKKLVKKKKPKTPAAAGAPAAADPNAAAPATPAPGTAPPPPPAPSGQ